MNTEVKVTLIVVFGFIACMFLLVSCEKHRSDNNAKVKLCTGIAGSVQQSVDCKSLTAQ